MNHLTQEQMGQRLHMSQSAYCKYENDKTPPSVGLLKNISEEFNIKMDELLSHIDNENVHFEIDKAIVDNANPRENHDFTPPKEKLEMLLENQKKLNSLIERILNKINL
ncbi:MAG: helix-turn-helix transcriptional regulator [Bacteroidetes bacterium]|nr:helix-turn-helix transcriptional regulator [Bacteroidota bacterium]